MTTPAAGGVGPGYRSVPARDWWRTEGSFFLLSEGHRAAREAERALDFLDRVVGLSPGKRVLDLACGWGRLALPLARRGCRVLGVDVSHVVRLGGEAALQEGLPVGFLRADLRHWPLRGSFDLVLLWAMSFGYLSEEEDLALLASAAGVLRPGGQLVLDLHHPPWYRRYAVGERVELVPGGILHDQGRWNEREHRFEVLSTLASGEGKVRARQFHSFREYLPGEVATLARKVGLRIVATYVDLRPDPRPPGPEDSSYQIALAPMARRSGVPGPRRGLIPTLPSPRSESSPGPSSPRRSRRQAGPPRPRAP